MYIIYSLQIKTGEVVVRNTYNSLKSAVANLENDVKNYVEIYKKDECKIVTELPQKIGWYGIRDENKVVLYNNTTLKGWITNGIDSEKVAIFSILVVQSQSISEEPEIIEIVHPRPSIRNDDFFNELSLNLKNRRKDIE